VAGQAVVEAESGAVETVDAAVAEVVEAAPVVQRSEQQWCCENAMTASADAWSQRDCGGACRRRW